MGVNWQGMRLKISGGGIAMLVWHEEIRAADIHYLDSNRSPKIIRLDLDTWPPTEDDIKRAEIIVSMNRR